MADADADADTPRRPARPAPHADRDATLAEARAGRPKPLPRPGRGARSRGAAGADAALVIDEAAMESLLDDLLYERSQHPVTQLATDSGTDDASGGASNADDSETAAPMTPRILIASADECSTNVLPALVDAAAERDSDGGSDESAEEEAERPGLPLNPLMIVTHTLADDYDTRALELPEHALPDYTSASYVAPGECDASIGSRLRMQVLAPPTHVGYIKRAPVPAPRYESARELAARVPSDRHLQPPPRPRKPVPKSGKRKRVRRIEHGRLQRPTEDVPLPEPFLVGDVGDRSRVTPPTANEGARDTVDIVDALLSEMVATQDETGVAREASALDVPDEALLRQYRVRASINDDDLVDELNDFGALADLTSGPL